MRNRINLSAPNTQNCCCFTLLLSCVVPRRAVSVSGPVATGDKMSKVAEPVLLPLRCCLRARIKSLTRRNETIQTDCLPGTAFHFRRPSSAGHPSARVRHRLSRGNLQSDIVVRHAVESVDWLARRAVTGRRRDERLRWLPVRDIRKHGRKKRLFVMDPIKN